METKPLSGWLLASDIDGTLNTKLRTLPDRNKQAIHRYVYELGGTFILASGRSIESMRAHFQKLELNHGYAVFTNGAGIYDYASEKILWLKSMDERSVAIAQSAAHLFRLAKCQIVTPKACYLVRPDYPARILANTHKLQMETFRSIDDVPQGDWCKVIFTGLPHLIDRVEAYVKEQNEGETKNLMRSSIASFEIVSRGTNKGVAVMKVAELLGIDPAHTAAIGDYFNDYEMLKSVAVPACCGQAPRGMKEIAKLVTCHCNKGAVADLIEYLIAHYANEIK